MAASELLRLNGSAVSGGGELGLAATLGAAVARSPAEPAIGGQVGRYTILGLLGAGGMGAVYAAYDAVLDRKVAVKLLHGGGEEAQLRLLREAQAMARVDHPNVVAVHEVGRAAEGQVFVAMEFIRGSTLFDWQAQPGRSWPEVLAAYVQAGRGLAAAHAAGLVHRDFKASNAMIDEHLRVRVLDFGLVRSTTTLRGGGGGGAAGLRLTQDGEVLGTPAYMAPEQIEGGKVGPAADQFSFCASLYEALMGQLPFAGETVGAMLASIASGRIQGSPRGHKVPAWLRVVVLRGLQARAEERHASMEALLRALDLRALARRNRRVGAVVVGGLLAASVAGFVLAGPRETPRCGGAEAALAGVWDPPQRARVATALALAGPAFASELWPRVAASLGSYAEGWKAVHRDACMSHQRGEQSAALLDLRMACLEQRRAALTEAVAVLTESDAAAMGALRVAQTLPTLARCSEASALATGVAPPEDPATAAGVAALRQALARAESLAQAGRVEEALTLAAAQVRVAEAGRHAPALVEALLVEGRLRVGRLPEDGARTDALLVRTRLTALAARMDEEAAEASALRVYVLGGAPEGPPEAALARALVARLPGPERVLGLLENNIGAAHLARGEVGQARASFATALAIRERAPERAIDLAYTLANLALVEDDAGRRELHLARALGLLAAELGPAHPETLEVQMSAARYVLDPQRAAALLGPGCAALARFASDRPGLMARCLTDLGDHQEEAGEVEAARATWLAAGAELERAEPGELSSFDAAMIRGRAAVAAGGSLPAVAELEAVIATLTEKWWQRRDRADLEGVQAQNLRALGRVEPAIAALRAAIADYAATNAETRDALGPRRLAQAQLELATLELARAELGSAAALLAAAEDWYAAAGPGFAGRRARVAALYAQLSAARTTPG